MHSEKKVGLMIVPGMPRLARIAGHQVSYCTAFKAEAEEED